MVRRLHACGPPTALLAHACAALVGMPALRLGRICVEILSPVPVGELTVSSRVLRGGGQVRLLAADLVADGRPVMLARCWFVREHPGLEVPRTPSTEAPDLRGTELPVPDGWGRGYLDAIEWRWVRGGFEQPGPACVWARPMVDLLAGEPTGDVTRLLLLADSASGISAVANPRDLVLVNIDLTVHLRRLPRGDWLWMAAETRIDPNGSGVTTGVLGDVGGDVASTGQLLFVRPRPPNRATP